MVLLLFALEDKLLVVQLGQGVYRVSNSEVDNRLEGEDCHGGAYLSADLWVPLSIKVSKGPIKLSFEELYLIGIHTNDDGQDEHVEHIADHDEQRELVLLLSLCVEPNHLYSRYDEHVKNVVYHND